MGSWARDLRYAARFLRQRPLFTAVAVLALTLGIGSNTAIFSVVQAVLLRPLPFPQPEQLVLLWESQPGMPNASFSPPDYEDIAALPAWQSISAYRHASFNLGTRSQPERVLAAETTASFFEVMQARAVVGRTYGAQDARSGAVVLSHRLWVRLFGAQPSVVGRTVTLNGQPTTILGVMGPELTLPRQAEMWVASRDGIPGAGSDKSVTRGEHYLRAVGRLSGSLSEAHAQLKALAARLAKEYPDSNEGHGFQAGELQEQLVSASRPALYMLLAAVALVLLIACANVANLLLARAATRQRELAIRVALGASRGQLVRQLLTESVVLAALGGGLGVLLAFWGVDALVALAGRALPRAAEVSVDGGALLFTAALAITTGIVFGLAPALSATSVDPDAALKDGGGGRVGEGRRRSRLRATLVVGEVAVAVVLLAAAGLMIRSFWKLSAVDPGFAPEGALTFRVSAPPSLTSEAQVTQYFQELDARVAALPGVSAAGATGNLPLSGSNTNSHVIIDGRPRPATSAEQTRLEEQAVTPGYFKAMGLRLLAGRLLTLADTAGAPKVMVVNEATARELFPGEDAVGKRVSFDTGDPDWVEIVGVVSDLRQFGLTEPTKPEAFFPHAQHPWRELSFVVRAPTDLGALATAVRREVAAIPPGEAAYNLRPLSELVSDSLAQRRFTLLLLLTFAAAALLLAAVGVYGVMSYSVAQRTRELGVRLALGARPMDVLRMVLRQGLALAGAGVGVGIALALFLTRLLSTLLYGVAPYDPGTLLAVALVLGVCAVVSCLAPAVAATRVDPMTSLRAE